MGSVMDWQTIKIMEETVDCISDEGVFTFDQIMLLSKMLAHIASAIDKESDCNKPSVTM